MRSLATRRDGIRATPQASPSPDPAGRRGRRGLLRRVLGALLLVPILTGVLAAPVATGDELSDALARQKALQAQIASQKKQVTKLNQLEATLKGEISETKQQLAGINADLTVVRTRIKKMTADINEVRTQYYALVDQLKALDAQLIQIQDEEKRKQEALDERKAILATRLQAAYENDRTSLLETILSAESFSDVISDVGYFLDLGEQDKALAQQIAREQETLAAIHQTVLATRAQTEDLRRETAAHKQDLVDRMADLRVAREQLKALEAATARELAIQQAAYAKLTRNEAALKKAIEADARAQAALKKKIDAIIAAQYARGNIPSKYNGSLAWPLAGIITQEFGCTGFRLEPWNGHCYFHNGIDIAAPKYTPVTAAGPGQVVYAGPLSGGAWVVIIAHSQELQTWYAHLDNAVKPPTVRAGDVVRPGEVIGYVGTTGRTTGPHLHWMVELNEIFVNPRLFV